MSNPPSVTWQLTSDRASLCQAGVSGIVDLAMPGRGLSRVSIDAQPAVEEMLGLSLPAHISVELVEAYVRGDDLVTTYRDSSDELFRWQAYWCASPQCVVNCLTAIELQLSVQTSLLASDPGLAVRGRFRAAELLQLSVAAPRHAKSLDLAHWGSKSIDADDEARGAFVARLGNGVSYIEIVYELDYSTTQVVVQSAPDERFDIELSHALFRQELEKGVILRARVLGALVPTAGDLAAAWELDRSLAAATLPLTA